MVGRKLLSERDENIPNLLKEIIIVSIMSEGNYSLKEMRTLPAPGSNVKSQEKSEGKYSLKEMRTNQACLLPLVTILKCRKETTL